MKVLIINNIYSPYRVGGAEVSVQVLAEGLRKNGHDVMIIALGNIEDENTKSGGVTYIKYPHVEKIWPVKKDRNIFSRLAFQYVGDFFKAHVSSKIAKTINLFRPDIVHTNNLAGIGSCVWPIVSSFNVPIVHTLRDYYHLCVKQTMYNQNMQCNCNRQCKMCFMATAIRRLRSSRVDMLVGNSDYILQAHIREGYFKNAKTNVVSGGLPDSFRLEEKTPPQSVTRVGYLGQLVFTKGVDDFIQLAHNFKQINFVVGGDVSNQYALQLTTKNSLSNLTWLGRVNPQEFLDSIDILIVPSKWHEPLPRVIYEAYARGVLVVATENGGNPSVMDELPQEYKFLYASENFDLLLSAFQKALDFILSKKFNPNILIKHSSLFSESRIIDKYSMIYEDLHSNYLKK
ncbi:MAG: glycosyltransferase [Bacteroidales bacterium]|nr:glycosyltransferase [Bacteroidales bacterium]